MKPVRQVAGCLLVWWAVVASSAFGEVASAPSQESLAGTWSGESITNELGVQRWVVERAADGTYQRDLKTYRRDGATETHDEGRWSIHDGVLRYEPADAGERQAWRTSALSPDCVQLRSSDAATGQPAASGLRAGECRLPGARPLPERVRHGCVMSAPGMKPGTLDLQVVREDSGEYHAIGDGERDEAVVDVRDYPVLPDFQPKRVETMTNAGEGLLVLVQMNVDENAALRRTLGFDPSAVRAVRAWVISPPRPERPMEFYSAGRFVLMQAFGKDGRLLGGAAYTPFIVACPARP
jgi:hypothetical protein